MVNSKKVNNRNLILFFEDRERLRKKNNNFFPLQDSRLINIVALAYINKKRLSVKDLMSLSELGSPASIHQRMKTLISSNYIELQITDDNRRFQVAPSRKLLDYFDSLGKVIISNIN